MKKIIPLLALCVIAACQNNASHESKFNAPKSEVASSESVGEAEAADKTAASDVTVAQGKSKTESQNKEKKEAEAPIASNAVPKKNIFNLSEYATTSRKIIRTSEIKSKVENTEKATYQIELMARKWDGFVTTNNLESRLKRQEETLIAADSMLVSTYSEAVNNICVRIPNQNLDTFLLEMSRIYAHLDYRRVHSNDLTASFLTNQLKAKLREQSSQRIASATDEKGKHLDDIVMAEDKRVELSDEAITQKVQNEETDYDIAFSTVNIDIYEDAVVSKSIIPIMAGGATTASFAFRCQHALSNGWSFLLNMIVGILNLWAFILVLGGAYMLYRRMKGKISLPKLLLSRKS